MLLPIPGHRIPALAEFRDLYASHAFLVNENEDAALGFVGSFGLLVLLFRAIFRRSANDPPRQVPGDTTPSIAGTPAMSAATLDALATLTLAGLLFATIGGIGPTLNYLGFTAIRGYNRISIFLAFFALLAVGGIIERLAINRRNKSQFILITASLLLILGLLDQISPRVVPDYQHNAKDFQSDAAFVASIESAMPSGASIFQMPVMFYPESAPINGLSDYELFRGYLHSSTLHWSYGAVGGRDAFAWQRQTIKLPLPELLTELRAKHFSGIYLDRSAYLDDSLERSLGSLLGQPMVSPDGRLVFFKFAGGAARQ
jgi:phosphoglycerol transferase